MKSIIITVLIGAHSNVAAAMVSSSSGGVARDPCRASGE